VQTLQLHPAASDPDRHAGEVSTCCFSTDNSFAISGGWDGYLRFWDAQDGGVTSTLKVSSKPVSSCGISPSGGEWYSGALDGLLSSWNAVTGQQITAFLAHTRPISSIVFAPNGGKIATAAWDCNVNIWDRCRDRRGKVLAGHTDIVAGCRFTADGSTLLSWSHDGTVRVWDIARGVSTRVFTGHIDRVVAGAISSDGSWALSGSRDGMVKLWNLKTAAEAASVHLDAEIRGCFFLLDGQSFGLVDAAGNIRLCVLPALESVHELATRLPVQCCDLAPSGGQIALGCADGNVRFVTIDGFDRAPLGVTATQTSRRTATRLQRLFGKSRLVDVFNCTCPACRQEFELPTADPSYKAPCPHCRRHVRVSTVVAAEQVS
jgi:WD40 repeat protein